MGIKLHEIVKLDGAHHSWCFYCPACEALHQCDNRWGFNGNVEAPTFEGSVLVHAVDVEETNYHRPRCHSFVKDGRIEYCGDSTHAMKGQTVELPDWDSVRDPFR